MSFALNNSLSLPDQNSNTTGIFSNALFGGEKKLTSGLFNNALSANNPFLNVNDQNKSNTGIFAALTNPK